MQMRVALVVTFAVAAIASFSRAQEPSQPNRMAALQLFQERVENYAALHRRLEGPLPPMKPTTDTRSLFLARKYLASAIRAARSTARQGDIFSPDVATVFRQLIGEAFKGREVEALLAELSEEHAWEHGTHSVVNEPYPEGATHEMPAILLQRLPPLPEDVEYRILDHDLVLWDIHADLVIDFVPFAFGTAPTTSDEK